MKKNIFVIIGLSIILSDASAQEHSSVTNNDLVGSEATLVAYTLPITRAGGFIPSNCCEPVRTLVNSHLMGCKVKVEVSDPIAESMIHYWAVTKDIVPPPCNAIANEVKNAADRAQAYKNIMDPSWDNVRGVQWGCDLPALIASTGWIRQSSDEIRAAKTTFDQRRPALDVCLWQNPPPYQ